MFANLFKKKDSTKKILVVDDEQDIVMILSKVLVHNGYRVVTAANGEECVAMAESELPDMILLDNGMPKMDGLTALGKLRNSGRTSHIPVIMVTAYASEENMLRARGYDVSGFVAKPFDYTVLLKKIKHALEPTTTMRR